VLKPLSSGAVVELMFSTHIGPVLAMAELLSPCSAAPIGLQPFRFIAMDNAELRKLRAAIALSQKTEAESPSGSHGGRIRREKTLVISAHISSPLAGGYEMS
jgi:hypothetical protein